MKIKFIRYLCFIVVDFIHSCHQRLKISSFSLKKKIILVSRSDLLVVNATAVFRILNSLDYKCIKNFGPLATAAILKILHPFKYPGLGVTSFKQMKTSFNNCLSFLLAEMATMTILVTKL